MKEQGQIVQFPSELLEVSNGISTRIVARQKQIDALVFLQEKDTKQLAIVREQMRVAQKPLRGKGKW